MTELRRKNALSTPLASGRLAAWSTSRAAEAFAYAPHAAAVLIACLGVWGLKKATLLKGDDPVADAALLAALTLGLAFVRARDLPPSLVIVHRTVTLLFGVYAVAAYPSVSDELLYESRYSAFVYLYAPPLGLAAAVVAWFRPSFGLLPVVFFGWKKHLMADQFGFPLNATDYSPVAELGLFLCVAAGVVRVFELGEARLRAAPPPADRWTIGEAAFLASLALHLANYFYSAVAKATLPGAGPFTWVLENNTHDIMLATAATGLGPLLGTPPLAWAGHELMARFHVFTNLLTYLSQFAALVVLLRIRWAMTLTAFYDAVHLMIFITTSILFWKWMTLNVGLVLALATLRDRTAPPWPLTVMSMGVLLLSPKIFWIAELGWFDSKALNKPVVEVVLKDGRIVEAPSNFFLEGSAQMAKGSVAWPAEGHFEDVDVFGKANLGFDQMVAARSCDLPVGEESGLSKTFAENPKLERYFRQHHAFILEHVDEEGRYPYNWFPHHNWSNPSLFEEFAAIDLREIAAYRYSIESVCLGYDDDGGVVETLRLRGSHDVSVQ
ncbi:MAG: hypothetical protein AAGF90_03670 [Pseudomonadota bacterium]